MNLLIIILPLQSTSRASAQVKHRVPRRLQGVLSVLGEEVANLCVIIACCCVSCQVGVHELCSFM